MADRPWRYRRVVVALVGVAIVALSACSDDDVGAPAEDISDEASGGGDQPGDEAFCAEMERLDVETSEDHVGSDEHVADIEGLAEVAPDDVRPAVERYRDFLASGAVTDDPESKQTDSWPADVQADIETIQEAAESRC